jgi:hypothetical protein
MPKQIATTKMKSTKKEKDHVQNGNMRLKGLKYNVNKKQAGNDQRPSKMDEDCTRSQSHNGLEKKKKEKEKKKKKTIITYD